MRNINADALIVGLAQKQHGIVARWQLVAADVPHNLIDQRVKRRTLERVDWRVYRVPGLDGPRRDVAARVLACGPHAAASHATAGGVRGLVENDGPRTVVSIARGHPDPRADLVLHRVRFAPDEVITYDGVRITTPARILLDLAAALPNRALEQALARALRLNAVTRDELARLMARYPRRSGTPRLRAMLGVPFLALTRSEAEELFLAIVRRALLPDPQVNARVHGFEADFYWPAHAVVAEIDGLAYHATRDAQQRDRHRDSSLAAAGIRVLRFTWEDLTVRPEPTLAKVAMALGHGLR